MRIYRSILYNVITVVVVVLIWALIARVINSRFFPTPMEVARALHALATVGDIEGISLGDHAVCSITRVLAGFGVACITAVPIGLLMGLNRGFYGSTKSVTETIRFVPPMAWIPVVIILFAGFSQYIVIIWLGAFFPILISTMTGVLRTDPTLISVAKVFGAKRRTTVSKVVIPSALPEVTAGMRIGLGIAWMCIVAAEMLGGGLTGLGRLILKYSQMLQIDMALAGIIVIGIIGLLMNEVFLRVEKRLFKWRVEVAV